MIVKPATKITDGLEELISAHLYGGIQYLGSMLFSDEYKSCFQRTFD